jgi:hypothetical protein
VDNNDMSTETAATAVSPEADLDAVVEALTAGKAVDPEVARRVRDRSAEARQKLLATRGVQDIGVAIIRELRGELPSK